MNERVSDLAGSSSEYDASEHLEITPVQNGSIVVHPESTDEETEEEKLEELSENDENHEDKAMKQTTTEQDDDSDSMLVDAIPSLAEQRETLSKIYLEHQKNAKEGDKVFIIPSVWFDRFWNTDITNYTDIDPIDTTLICKDFKNFVLADYNVSPYLSVPEPVFQKFTEWYGLTTDSKPVSTVLIADENGLLTEYNRCFFRVHLLKATPEENRSYNGNSSPLFFTLSKLSSIKDVVQRCLEVFEEHEEKFDIRKHRFRIWYFKDSGNAEENASFINRYKISPMVFSEILIKHRIQPKIFGCLIKDLKFSVVDLAVEYKEPNKGQHWPSNFFVYHKPCPSKGTVGLSNLGNTCYMNSALQCLVHIPELKDYFLYNGFEGEMNSSNPLGYGGRIAQAFAGLIQTLFSESISGITTYSPRNFKTVIGHFNSMFSGFLQQDSQEFLAFLLDGLHEDLNRILEKPYVEKPELSPNDDVNDFEVIKELAQNTWEKHKLRNDSVIIDLFVGMYKSTLVCPKCNNISITFDPYNDLTLPLPVDNCWTSKIMLFPHKSPPCILEVELSKTASYQDLKLYVAKAANMKVEDLLGAEIFNHQFYNNYEARTSDAQYLPVHDLISKDDLVVFYEVPRAANDMVVPVLNTKFESGFKNAKIFGYPFFIALSEEEQFSYGAIRKKLEQCYVNLSGGFIDFPSLSNEPNPVLDSLPLLSQKYQNVNFSQFADDIKVCTPNEPIDKYFSIKALDCNRRKRHENSDPPLISDSNEARCEVWTPDSRSQLNLAVDITSAMNNVTKDIYNYYDLERNQKQEIEELGRLTEEGEVASPALKTESDNGQENSSDMDVDVEDNLGEHHDTQSAKMELSQETYPLQQLINMNSAIVCEWNSEAACQVFSEDREISWSTPGILVNSALEASREQKNGASDAKINLEDCLRLFSKPEVLGASDSWFCPGCKEHRQATKQIELWNTPDILLIHLKRFENMRSFSDKINEIVHFPITGLDMSPFLAYNDESRNNVYDLIAVDNHYGGLGGGHYTAFVKNAADGEWYYFDDSRVSKTVPERSISGAAYLLFYKRRVENGHLGSDNLTKIIASSREQHDLKIQEFNERQAEFYKENISEDEDEPSEEEEQKLAFDIESPEKSVDLLVSEDKENQATSNKDLDYSIASLEVGDHVKDSSSEENAARRKLRLLNKTYLNTPVNSSDMASAAASSESSDESESISHKHISSSVNPAPQSPSV